LALVRPKVKQRVSVEASALARVRALPRTAPRVLFHAPSMGELEQCLPVIHAVRRYRPEVDVVVSDSSPSGYNHALRCPEITAACYLPPDAPDLMAEFLNAVAPTVVVIDRYDVWPGFIAECTRRSIPIVLMNATFPSAARNPVLRGLLRDTYTQLTSVTAVSDEDARALRTLIGRDVPVLPDTRMDRVRERIASPDADLERFRRTDHTTIVCGSCWPPDEELVFDALAIVPDPTLRLIIVPHEPTEDALRRIEARLTVTRLSRADAGTQGHLVVDSVGKLLSLYALADAAFVGGGFGAGVHSVAEPAGYGLPLACGPAIDRSRDATDLVRQGACTVVRSASDVATWIRTAVLDDQTRRQIGSQSSQYVFDRSGSSEQYALHITTFLSEGP